MDKKYLGLLKSAHQKTEDSFNTSIAIKIGDSFNDIKTTCTGHGITEFDLQHKFMKVVNSNYNIYAEIKNNNLIMSTNSFTETSNLMNILP